MPLLGLLVAISVNVVATTSPKHGGEFGLGRGVRARTGAVHHELRPRLRHVGVGRRSAMLEPGVRGHRPPVASPKQAQWAAPMSALQERIMEEWRRKEKKGYCSGSATTSGLLVEMQAVELAARELNSVLEEIAEEEEEEDDDEWRRQGIVDEERTDAVWPLLDLMADPESGMVDKAAYVLHSLVSSGEGRAATVEEGGIPVLVEMVEVGTSRQKIATLSLLQIGIDHDGADDGDRGVEERMSVGSMEGGR
uniref:ARM repeat superfamily protein n=1 Tax=Zea mays TaxID=4577 RepID=A0A804MRQ3_MAIZE